MTPFLSSDPPSTRKLPQRIVAYTDDAEVADGLARLADGGRIPSAEVMPGGVTAALIDLDPKADALILDLVGVDNPTDTIAAIAHQTTARLIAIGQDNDIALYRHLRHAGAADYLVPPLSDAELLEALETEEAPLQTTLKGETETLVARRNAIIGCRGGVGASAFAISTAWWVAERLGLSTALIDLDLSFGTSALSLDLLPGRGLREAIEQPDRIDPLFVGSAMINATDRLFVLGAEEHPSLEIIPAREGFSNLIDAVAESVSSIIVDVPRSILPLAGEMLERMDTITLVSDLSLAGLRDAIRLRTMCKELAPNAQVSLVAFAPASGPPAVDRKEFERACECAIDWVIPWTPKQAAEAASMGKPIALKLKPKHPYCAAAMDLAQRAVPTTAQPEKKAKRKWLW